MAIANLFFPVWLRSNYYSSPALSKTIDTAISMAGVEKNQIDVLDIYS